MVTLLRGRRAGPSAWADLQAPWPTCFNLAWDAYRAGTIPTGAVVTDGTGQIVARGRSRVHDREAPPGRLCDSPLAHAEIDALLGLSPEARYEDHTLWTTLEPCLLCIGAAVTACVGALRWASPDPYAGATGAVYGTPHSARLPLGGGRPLDGPMGLVGAVLHLEPFVRNNPGGAVVGAHRLGAPEVTAAAGTLATRETLQRAAAAGARFADVIEDILLALPA
jgi:tRNA(Arg) A34 adenosine deaminase TadA